MLTLSLWGLNMTLPIKAIDRLFERLGATYGEQWNRQWANIPITDVKSAWAHELSGFAGQLEALAWGLENLPERCPNVIEFRNLCRRAPAPELPRLPEPKADPERMRRELSKLGQIKQQVLAIKTLDGKEWARRIIAKHEAGENIRPVNLRFAQEALGIKA
jgi:hypothetical protein